MIIYFCVSQWFSCPDFLAISTWVMLAWCWCWRPEPWAMVVMEGDRQGQGGQAGWYEGGAGAGATSPLPSAQHHQVTSWWPRTGNIFHILISSKCQEASTNESDNYFKTTSTASQYFMQSAYGGIQSHGKWKLLNLGGREGVGKVASFKLKSVQAENCANINRRKHFTRNIYLLCGRLSVSVSRGLFILINSRKYPNHLDGESFSWIRPGRADHPKW